jgi:hypothetical protein
MTGRVTDAPTLRRELRRLARNDLLGDTDCLIAFTRSLVNDGSPSKGLRHIDLLPIDGVRKGKAWKKRRDELKKAYPADWGQRWREERRVLQLIARGQHYDWKAIHRLRQHLGGEGRPKTGQSRALERLIPAPSRPKETTLWSVVWMLKAYLERVLELAVVRWDIIAELVNQGQGTQKWTATSLRKGWDKRAHDFEVEVFPDDGVRDEDWRREELNAEGFLYGKFLHLAGLMAHDERWGDKRYRDFVADVVWKLDGLDSEEGFHRQELRKRKLDELVRTPVDIEQ